MADCMPVELVDIVLQNLASNLSDLHGCSSVCSQWRRAAKSIISLIPTPLLYLSPLTIRGEKRQPGTVVTLFGNEIQNTTYDIILPDCLSQSRKAHITHKGWFLYSDDPKSVFLYNPLSRDRVVILPQIITAHSDYEVQFVTSTAPTNPECIILAYFKFPDGTDRVDFCKPGDDTWKTVHASGVDHRIRDMIYSNGSFYAVGIYGDLFRFDLHVRRIYKSVTEFSNTLRPSDIYLVESPGKELLLVCREYDSIKVRNMNCKQLMRTLDEGSIFLARCDSIFIKTTDYRSNCIYFFDETWGTNGNSDDFGFYDMKSGRTEKINMMKSSDVLFYRWFV